MKLKTRVSVSLNRTRRKSSNRFARWVRETGFREVPGWGWAICKKLVELMEGRLRVRSVLGKGSLFSFEVSLPEGAGPEKDSTAQKLISGYQGARRKILVGDDIQSNRRLIQDLLSPLGFEILEAIDGQDVLAKTRKENPDLIIMDSAMPVKDGLTCIREIRKIPERKNIRIITLSARVLEADRRASLEAGADDFLPKPVDTEGAAENSGRAIRAGMGLRNAHRRRCRI